MLADAIARADPTMCRVAAADPPTVPTSGPVVVATDCWDTRNHPAVRQACRERQLTWLPVRTELGRVVVGPIEFAQQPGCVLCAESRRERARRYPEGFAAVLARHAEALAQRPSELLTVLAADLVAQLVVAELADPVRTRAAMIYVDLRTLQVETHRFLPDPRCPHCGDLPLDDAASARIALRPRRKLAPDTYRVRAIADELDQLKATFVDPECGLIRAIHRAGAGGSAVATAPMGMHDGAVENGYGRSSSYRTSETIALLEALERYGGMQPYGKRTAVQARYHDVRDQAVDPRTLGFHSEEAYRSDNFWFHPFDENTIRRWVWGYSFATATPVLVPESYAYYGTHNEDAFVYETSNGCALGSSLEEAILYGLLEVAERDAFLMTWYARMAVPRVNPWSARNSAVPTLLRAIESETGYQVAIFDITLEQAIPCVWVMATDPTDDNSRPKAVCAAGSHLHPERAAENALNELGPILTSLMSTYSLERSRAMVADPSLVKAMEDHSVLYGDQAAFCRFDFLLGSRSVRSFADMTDPRDNLRDDLTDDLRAVLSRYHESGLDVIVVDQTAPEHRAGGLSCVKVIVPGTLPMTFGHHARRVEGIPRLLDVPYLLGRRSQRLEPGDVNPHPHPFP